MKELIAKLLQLKTPGKIGVTVGAIGVLALLFYQFFYSDVRDDIGRAEAQRGDLETEKTSYAKRKREYLADATAAQLTRNPGALATALEKLAAASDPTRSITNGAAHLCIVDPTTNRFSEREGVLGDIFASHPPIAQRVIRLKGMAYQQAKRESPPAAAAS